MESTRNIPIIAAQQLRAVVARIRQVIAQYDRDTYDPTLAQGVAPSIAQLLEIADRLEAIAARPDPADVDAIMETELLRLHAQDPERRAPAIERHAGDTRATRQVPSRAATGGSNTSRLSRRAITRPRRAPWRPSWTSRSVVSTAVSISGTARVGHGSTTTAYLRCVLSSRSPGVAPMAKNLDAQGEIKSAPQAITKLPRHRCTRCGLVMPAPIVTAADGCTNRTACARRASRRAKAS